MTTGGVWEPDPPATPTALPGASGQLVANVGRLMGVSIDESTGGASAKVRLRNSNATGAILEVVTLSAGESARDWYGPGGKRVPSGVVYFELVSGSVEGTAFTL